MIKSFKHKGLRQLFEKGIGTGLPAKDLERINDRLQSIDIAKEISEINRPVYRLTPLKVIGKVSGLLQSGLTGALLFSLSTVMHTFLTMRIITDEAV